MFAARLHVMPSCLCVVRRNVSMFSPASRPQVELFQKIDTRSFATNDSGVLMNNKIVFPNIRVVFDDATGKSCWRIMKRRDALIFAESKKLDLVLVKAPAAEEELAVCVLQDFEAMRMEKQKKAKDLPKKKANKPMKEIRIGALCDTHDLNTKLSKVKNFLGDGLQVKVSIFSRKVVTREHPLALDETTLRVLDGLESVAGPVQSVSKESSRVEFIISPMKKKE